MRKDLDAYLFQLASQVERMNKTLEVVNKQIQDGLMTEEQAEQFKNMVGTITGNYQRVVYCKYLLNKRPEWMDKLSGKWKEVKAKLEEFKEGRADRESVCEENEKALEGMAELSESIEDSAKISDCADEGTPEEKPTTEDEGTREECVFEEEQG